MAPPDDLIVFSHLRWSFVWQRPQHLLSRFAQDRRVFFVEEPIFTDQAAPFWEISTVQKNVFVCRPHTPIPMHGFCDEQIVELRQLCRRLLIDKQINEYVTWFYTPMAFPILENLRPKAIIYDCMDNLAGFLNAPRQMAEREQQLLEQAELVFTGGPSLYLAKRDCHPSVHCFPSSVDAAHFGSAQEALEQPEQQRQLPHPILGFFGVIDERLDIPLLSKLAHARPDWQVVMVGPIVKIDPATLPRPANMHYFGQQEYGDLPKFLCGWDACLLPFALNEATRFISPTKTLEYMAALKPIVSTRITDVAEPYGDIVYIADTPDEFVAACEQALARSPQDANPRFSKMREVIAKMDWHNTAAAMSGLIQQVVESKGVNCQIDEKQSSTSRIVPLGPPSPSQVSVAIIGAGPTGLSAAYHLGDSALLLEQNQQVGGWCRSIQTNGFTFDFAGHIMFSNDPYVHAMYERLLGSNVHWQDREAWIYSKGTYTRYPFQGALYGLPPEVIKDCILGAIEARFGRIDNSADNGSCKAVKPSLNGNGKAHESADKSANPQGITDCCADGLLESTAPLATATTDGHGQLPSEDFEQFIYRVWGAGIAKHFAIPYNRKLWAVPLTEMETSWLGGRVPMPNLAEMIDGALSPVGKPMGPNARFGYPLKGGFQALMDGFLPLLDAELRLGVRVTGFSPHRHELELSDGTTIAYDQLISTMPLPVLVDLAANETPAEVRAAASSLRYVSVRCVHLGIGRHNLTEKHWIYYPEDTVFHRIFVQGNASPDCNPAGGLGLTCEITYHQQYKPLPCDGDALIDRCLTDCRRVGIIHDDDPVWAATQVDLPHAYVVYDHARPKNVALIRRWLESHDVLLAGRYSEWEYYNSDHAFLAGKKAAEHVQSRAGSRQSTRRVLKAVGIRPGVGVSQ